MPPNNIWDERNLRKDRIYFLIKKKRLNTMTVEKLNTLSGIIDSNNSSHSNIFRELYR